MGKYTISFTLPYTHIYTHILADTHNDRLQTVPIPSNAPKITGLYYKATVDSKGREEMHTAREEKKIGGTKDDMVPRTIKSTDEAQSYYCATRAGGCYNLTVRRTPLSSYSLMVFNALLLATSLTIWNLTISRLTYHTPRLPVY
jgi:hypothetical protein